MQKINPEIKYGILKTAAIVALTFLLTACSGIDRNKSQPTSPNFDYAEKLTKQLTDPCFNQQGVTENEFLKPTKPEQIWANSSFTETKSLPVASLDIMKGLETSRYALNYEYFMYNQEGNCVLFRSASIVNVTDEYSGAIDFDLHTGHSIVDLGTSETGKKIALYDLTNPTYTPATKTPEFEGLGIDPRLFQYMQLHPGEMLLKITLAVPAVSKSNESDLVKASFRNLKPKFSFFQTITTPPESENLNLHDLIYYLSPNKLAALKILVVQIYGN